MVLTERTTHTHTHTDKPYDILTVEVPNDYNSLLWLHCPALNQLLNTVAIQSHKQTLTARSSH